MALDDYRVWDKLEPGVETNVSIGDTDEIRDDVRPV